jgi:hypothetical protein
MCFPVPREKPKEELPVAVQLVRVHPGPKAKPKAVLPVETQLVIVQVAPLAMPAVPLLDPEAQRSATQLDPSPMPFPPFPVA